VILDRRRLRRKNDISVILIKRINKANIAIIIITVNECFIGDNSIELNEDDEGK
jgi:hypothetical protein